MFKSYKVSNFPTLLKIWFLFCEIKQHSDCYLIFNGCYKCSDSPLLCKKGEKTSRKNLKFFCRKSHREYEQPLLKVLSSFREQLSKTVLWALPFIISTIWS